jgi:hypothetical protein
MTVYGRVDTLVLGDACDRIPATISIPEMRSVADVMPRANLRIMFRLLEGFFTWFRFMPMSVFVVSIGKLSFAECGQMTEWL